MDFLDKTALENIKNYKYKTHGLTFLERNLFEHWWEFSVKLIPKVIYLISSSRPLRPTFSRYPAS